MVVVKINDKILLYIFGYFGLYTFGSCIPLGLVYLWLVYLWLCIPLGDIPIYSCTLRLLEYGCTYLLWEREF